MSCQVSGHNLVAKVFWFFFFKKELLALLDGARDLERWDGA
jgi:hypothetical protein